MEQQRQLCAATHPEHATKARVQAEYAMRLQAQQQTAYEDKLKALEQEKVRDVDGLVQGYEPITAHLGSETTTNE